MLTARLAYSGGHVTAVGARAKCNRTKEKRKKKQGVKDTTFINEVPPTSDSFNAGVASACVPLVLITWVNDAL